MREVREREVTGESGSEREREWYFLFKWLWGPDDQIMEIETPRPESPDQWPEYPGVTVSTTARSRSSWAFAWLLM